MGRASYLLCLLTALATACTSCSGSSKKRDLPVDTAAPAGDSDPASEDGADGTRLTPEMARLYFAGRGAEEFALEDWSAARKKFAAALSKASGTEALRLRLVIAECDSGLEKWEQAANEFANLAGSLEQIGEYIELRAAQSFFAAGAYDRALDHVGKVAADSRHHETAVLLHGEILRAQKKWAEAVTHYRSYLDGREGDASASETRFHLAEALKELGKPVDAARAYRRVTIEAPVEEWGLEAAERLSEVSATLPKAEQARLKRFSASEYIERGTALFRAQRNKESEADFDAAMSTRGVTKDQLCVAAYHRAKSVWNQRNRKRAAPLFDEAIAACDNTQNSELQVQAAYNAGRSYGRINRSETSIERYALVEKNHPKHSYADDARLRAAEEFDELDDQESVTEYLSSIPTRYPAGDMRGEAMWRLAWRAFKNKKHKESIGWLEKQLETKPLHANWWENGQPQYWIGRNHAELGDQEAAKAAFRRTAVEFPLSYYALLALNRLREMDSDEFEELVAELKQVPAGYDPATPEFSFQPRPVYATVGFRRGLEFLRLGLGAEAEAEFSAVGIAGGSGRRQVSDEDEIDKLWTMAYLYDAARRFDKSHWVTRWELADYRQSWPTAANRERWRIAYPLAFWKLLSKHAGEHGFPPHLIIAFVREESAFYPLRESWANAIGLTQMIFPTARQYAKGTGIEVTRENLRDPEKNVTIGSRFLAALMKRYDNRVMLVVPSYNTGPNRVARYIRERPGFANDALNEDIPLDEPRRYSKRVIASFFTYSYLEDGTIPELPNDIPKMYGRKRR